MRPDPVDDLADDPMERVAGSRLSYTARGHAWKSVLRSLRVRPFASAATLLVLGTVLALPTLVLMANDVLTDLAGRAGSDASLTAYLATDVPDLDGATLAAEIGTRPDVARARYVSRDEALATFRAASDLDAALDALDENPLPGAVVVNPSGAGRGDAERLAAVLRGSDGVERVVYDLRWVERLDAVVRLARTAGWLLAGFLTLTALLVIGNTVRLELLRREDEREVAHLLGASRAFVNRPLVYTGLLYGAVAGVAALVLALIAFAVLTAPARDLARLWDGAFEPSLPVVALACVPLASALLGLLGAWSTLSRPSRQMSVRA